MQNELYGPLNAVRIILKMKGAEAAPLLVELMPRIEEVLKRAEQDAANVKPGRSLESVANDVLCLFKYGPDFTPDQNRGLASLRAALDRRFGIEHPDDETCLRF